MRPVSAPTSLGGGTAFDRDPDDEPETLEDEMSMDGKGEYNILITHFKSTHGRGINAAPLRT